MDFHLSPNQRELIDLARRLAVECFTPRASALDNNAEFPVEDYQDLKASGLLGPVSYTHLTLPTTPYV